MFADFLVLFYFNVWFSENEGRSLGKEMEVTPKDLFFFLTGSDRIPPMGFDAKRTIVFDHKENTRENRLLSVSTCLLQLRLPVCDSLTEDYDVFKEQMNLAVLGSVRFGVEVYPVNIITEIGKMIKKFCSKCHVRFQMLLLFCQSLSAMTIFHLIAITSTCFYRKML